MKKIIIAGGGFAGLNAARKLGKNRELEITLIDRRNHHLFQPLLYQVAMAGLSPAEIAVPIRSLLSGHKNTQVIQDEITEIDLGEKSVKTRKNTFDYDYLLLACGAMHSYFGNEKWEEFAPGLKTIQQATEIRRRVLTAFELAESETDAAVKRSLLTFVVVGGGPTGVELAGAIGEMSRYTLARDFKQIDPAHARIFLIEAGERILPAFSKKLSDRAGRDLEKLGVQLWVNSMVTSITSNEVKVGEEKIRTHTVLWAAGVQASPLGEKMGTPTDRQGRIVVRADLSLEGYPEVFVAGDQAHAVGKNGSLLPGLAPVALQQGRFIAKNLMRELAGKERKAFHYTDKGQMATIGRGRAIAETAGLKIAGFPAWMIWLVIHIYYLTGFRNKFFVVLSWAWSYLNFKRGARLIIPKEWRLYG
jgi:NADH dehydrogenase